MMARLHLRREPPDVPDTDDPMFRETIDAAHDRLDVVNRDLEILELRRKVIERR